MVYYIDRQILKEKGGVCIRGKEGFSLDMYSIHTF